MIEADVAVIGGGVTGAAIARELSKYKVETVLLEKSGELAAGQSKATLGNIYTGLNMVGSMVLKSVMMPPGTPLSKAHDSKKLLTQWSEKGFQEWPAVLDELGVRHQYMPVMVAAKDEDQIQDLNRYIEIGEDLGGVYADFKKVDRSQIRELEPKLNKEIVMALYAENHIIDIFPPEVVIALGEVARQNGVKVVLRSEVSNIEQKKDSFVLSTTGGSVEARFVVNAAGGWADRIADMVGGRDWNLSFNKTPFIILDRRSKGLVHCMVRWPNKPGMLQVVQPRDENILIECGYYETTDRPDDTGTIRKSVYASLAMAKSLVPAISDDDIISTFTGVRVFNTRNVGDHIVEPSRANPRFFNVVIRLPGIIGALPMAKYVVDLLGRAGLELVRNGEFNPFRKTCSKVRDLELDEISELTERDSRYGNVICLCETVSEGEVAQALDRGAVTVEGIKFRTRATMGRCQGNFCRPHLERMLGERGKGSAPERMLMGNRCEHE